MEPIRTDEILDHVPAVVFRLSHEEDDWKTLYVSEGISNYGYTTEEFESGEIRWLDLVHPDDKVLVRKTVRDYEEHHINNFRLYYRLVTKEGDSIPVTEFNTVNRDEDGTILSYDTTIVSSTFAPSTESQSLIDNHYRQQIVMNDIMMSLHDADLDHALQIILDRTGEYLDTSRALLFKDSPDHTTCKVVYEWDNQGISSIMDLDNTIDYESEMPEIYHALRDTGSLIVDFGNIPDNCKEEFEAEGLIASAIFAIYLNGDHYGFVCFDDCIVERTWDDDTIRFLKNISNLVSTVVARQHAAEKLEQSQNHVKEMAFTDYLTKLANRFSGDRDLKEAIVEAREQGTSGYLLFLDLDDFKIINDSYGHDYGDAVLVSVSEWLREAFPTPHKVYRVGGDEFTILLDHTTSVDIDAVLESMHDRSTRPWQAIDREFYCSMSIGVVKYPSGDDDSVTLTKHADIAMYEAKRLGKNRHSTYEAELDASSTERTNTEILLRKAMRNSFEGFEVYYQPVVNQKEKNIEAAEALLRIRDGERIVLPSEFLPLAEYLGFTIALGDFVLRTAVSQCKHINENGFPDFKVCVNMTRKQLQQQDAITQIVGTIEEIGVNRHNVIVSIAADVLAEESERMKSLCEKLTMEGISVSVDDFSGGSATFLELKELPVEIVTTSIQLIQNVEDSFAQEYLKLLIRLCHSLGKQVCINGVETEKQYDFCRSSDVDAMQGFYLYEVARAEELVASLNA